jgi:hypothetical protein
MLTLKCQIEIRSKSTKKTVRFDYANSIEVKTSCNSLTDTAVLKLPRKMSWRGKPLTDFVRRNDGITIRAGYAEHGLETLFQGYVKDVENGRPVEITCENEMRRLKGITVEPEIIPNFDIRSFMRRYAPDIRVAGPDKINFGEVIVDERQSLASFLDELTRKFDWFRAFFRDGVFVALFDPDALDDVRVISLDPTRNVISDSLKYTLAEDVRVCVKATSIQDDNTKIEVTVPAEAEAKPSEYEQRHFYIPNYKDKASLKEAAEKKLAEYKTDKMEGTLTLFGVPFVRKGDVVRLTDKDRPERDGKRFRIDAVTYSFGTGGYRQEVTLGKRVRS